MNENKALHPPLLVSRALRGLSFDLPNRTGVILEIPAPSPAMALAVSVRDRHGAYITERILGGAIAQGATYSGPHRDAILLSDLPSVVAALEAALTYDEKEGHI